MTRRELLLKPRRTDKDDNMFAKQEENQKKKKKTDSIVNINFSYAFPSFVYLFVCFFSYITAIRHPYLFYSSSSLLVIAVLLLCLIFFLSSSVLLFSSFFFLVCQFYYMGLQLKDNFLLFILQYFLEYFSVLSFFKILFCISISLCISQGKFNDIISLSSLSLTSSSPSFIIVPNIFFILC